MSLHHLKIGHRLALGFGIVIALMLTLSAIAVLQLDRVRSSVDTMASTAYPRIAMAHGAKSSLEEIARGMRNMLFLSVATEVQAELAAVQTAGEREKATMARFDPLPGPAPERQLIDEVQRARAAWLPALAAYLQLIRDGDTEQARDLSLPAVAPLQQRVFEALDRLIAYEDTQMNQAREQAGAVARHTRLLVLGLAGAALLLALLVSGTVSRSITRPLNDAVGVARRVARGDLSAEVRVRGRDEAGQLLEALRDMNGSLADIVAGVRRGTLSIAEASGEIAAGNADLSARTEQQSGALQQTASAMEQLTANVRINASSARQASELAGTASRHAERGGRVVGEVVATMGSIKESSRRIGDIIGVIDSIAFQTNILALNAAVEAARAGSQGRGFAVVAAEVRSLAQRSAEAAKEVRSLIVDSVGKVDAGGRLVDEARSAMGDIVASVAHVTGIMEHITDASAEQSAGIEDINLAINRMDDMTRQNAALVEQAAAAAESMRRQAGDLSRSVSVFQLRDRDGLPATQGRAALLIG